MYRVFLLTILLGYCSSAPYSASTLRQSPSKGDNDGETVDSAGSGYLYYKNQQIDSRPSSGSTLIDLSDHDISTYLRSSALDNYQSDKPNRNRNLPTDDDTYGQQQLIPRANNPPQNLLPKTNQNQQSTYRNQKDFSQRPGPSSSRYNNQQENLPMQSKSSTKNTYRNQQQESPLTSQGWNNQWRYNPYDNLNNDIGYMPPPQRVNFRSQPMLGAGW